MYFYAIILIFSTITVSLIRPTFAREKRELHDNSVNLEEDYDERPIFFNFNPVPQQKPQLVRQKTKQTVRQLIQQRLQKQQITQQTVQTPVRSEIHKQSQHQIQEPTFIDGQTFAQPTVTPVIIRAHDQQLPLLRARDEPNAKLFRIDDQSKTQQKMHDQSNKQLFRVHDKKPLLHANDQQTPMSNLEFKETGLKKPTDSMCPQLKWRPIMEKGIKSGDPTASIDRIQSDLTLSQPGIYIVMCTMADQHEKLAKKLTLNSKGDNYCQLVKDHVWCQAIGLNMKATHQTVELGL